MLRRGIAVGRVQPRLRAATLSRPFNANVLHRGNRVIVRYASTESDEKLPESPAPKKMGFIDRLISLMPRDEPLILAEALVNSCTEQAADENFHKYCGVNLESGFTELSLKAAHIWIVHQRIKTDDLPRKRQKDLVYKIYENLWEDLDREMYDSGLLFLNKHLKQAQASVYGALTSYDKGLQIYENDGDCDPFLGAIWRNLYEGKKDIDKAHLIQTRDYIFRELANVRELDRKDFYNGFIKWGPPPSSLPEATEESKVLDEAFADEKMVDKDEGRRYWTTLAHKFN